MIQKTVYFLVLLPILVLSSGCKDDEKSAELTETFVTKFYKDASSLEIQVGFEEGAKPYSIHNGRNAWEITQSNLESLLEAKNVTIKVPTNPAEITNLGELEQINYTRQNIIDVSANLQQYSNDETTKGMTVLFLDGYFIQNGEPNDRILGINVNGSSVLAIFKPVINSASSASSARTLIEQTTVVHEIGHALGLVNNGVEPTSDHHDEQNGAHCTNEKCVMFWQNSGAQIADFIQPFILGGQMDLFGEQCVADIRAK